MTYAAGTNSPWGFRPERHINGSSWNGQTKIFRIASAYATSLYTGDPVTQNGNGTITIATAGANPIIGIFMGVKYIDASGNPQYSQYWPANTVCTSPSGLGAYADAEVCVDTSVEYNIQVSNSTNVAPTAANVSIQTAQLFSNAAFGVAGGGNAGITNPATGSTLTGQSAYYLDASTLAVTADLQLKVIDFVQAPGNVSGVLYNNVYVTLNNDVLNSGTGTLGV